MTATLAAFWTAVFATALTVANVALYIGWRKAQKVVVSYWKMLQASGKTQQNARRQGYEYGVREAHQKFLRQWDRASRGGDDGHQCKWRTRMVAAKASMDDLKAKSAPEPPK